MHCRKAVSVGIGQGLLKRSRARQLEWIDAHGTDHPTIVAERDGRILGFASLSRYRPEVGYRYTVEDSVYVDRVARGGRVGALLLATLIDLARDIGHHVIVARIVAGHARSIRLHEAHGFEPAGVERGVGRKFDEWLDVVVMQHAIDTES